MAGVNGRGLKEGSVVSDRTPRIQGTVLHVVCPVSAHG